MRVLILGGTGFVGRHLLIECRQRGDTLHGSFRPGEPLPAKDDVAWHPVDLLEPDTIRRAVRAADPDGIVHLAGQADVGLAQRDPLGTFRINAEGTLHVMTVLREIAPDTPTLAITSAEVYGAVPGEELPVTESRPLDPRSPYGASKAAADLVAAQAARGWGLPVVRMRPFNHVGPGQRLGFVAPDFASQVAAIERRESEPVLRVGNLSGRRDFTDVRDIVRGYRDALVSGRPGEAYNLCAGVSTSIESIVSFFTDRATVDIEIRREESRVRPVDVPEFRGDATKARHDFGWRPIIPLEQSLQEVLEEWRRAREEVPHPTD